MEIISENIGLIVTGISSLLIGLSPTIKNYILTKTKWKTEKVSVEAQTLSRITEAAGELSENSLLQIEATREILALSSEALRRQVEMTERETDRADSYQVEIETLTARVNQLGLSVISCSKELVLIVSDLNDGIHIDKERLDRLEANWK